MTWLRSPRFLLLLAVTLCVALHFAAHTGRTVSPVDAAIPAAPAGSFAPDGWFPGEPLASASAVRAWGSWSGSDQNTGTLRLGPFPAPRVLRLALGGYPSAPGNTLHVELAGTRETTPVTYSAIGERWAVCDITLPAAWKNRPVLLIATDRAQGHAGWFAVTEPLRGGQSDGLHSLLKTFGAWLASGILLGVLYLAAARQLVARTALPSHWIPLCAGAAVALCGYLNAWAYQAHPWLGWLLSLTALASAVIALRRPSTDAARADFVSATTLLLALGAFTLALLHLFPTGHDFYTLAAHRFHQPPATENLATHLATEQLFAGQPATVASPLQTGTQLLTAPVAKLFALDRRAFSGTAAFWLQLLWIPAAYGLLRSLAVSPPRAAGWIVSFGLTGFLFFHTVIASSAFLAGALACGAFGLAFSPRPSAFLSALLAALALVAHLSAAFALLPLATLLLWRAARTPRALRAALAPTFLGLILVLPALIHRGEPPLTTWHLAPGETLLELPRQFLPDARPLFDLAADTAPARRAQELSLLIRTVSWWPFLALFAVVLTTRPLLAASRDLALLATWLVATLFLAAFLAFSSSTLPLPLPLAASAATLAVLVLCSVLLERAGRLGLPACLALQAVAFATTWPLANDAITGEPTALPIVLLTALPLAWLALRAIASPVTAPSLNSQPSTLNSAQPSTPRPAIAPQERRQLNSPATFAAPFRAWWQTPRLTFWALAVFALLFFLRKPHALHTPQLWAEDGSIFLMQNDLHGPAALAMPYMGYLHTLPRLIAVVTARVSDPAWWPAIYNGISFLIWLAVALRLFSARFNLPGKPWLALVLVAVPHTGEVLFNITNLQWLTAFVLVQQAIVAAPVTRAQRVSDLLILALVTLTGPFGLAFLPLFFLRCVFAAEFNPRRLLQPPARDALFALATVVACAAIQAWFVRSGPRFDFQSAPFQLWPNLVILARRLVAWPLLGREVALALPPAVIGACGTALLAALVAWALRPDPLRRTRLHVLAALALITLAAVYRTRPDTWAADHLDFGDRYFYIPRVLLLWLLIWEFHARPRAVALAARAACCLIALALVRDYSISAPPDYHWATQVEPIRRGQRADLRTLPEGWILEYHGRPAR